MTQKKTGDVTSFCKRKLPARLDDTCMENGSSEGQLGFDKTVK